MTDLVIIGNSLTGLVAAIAAAKKGLSVRLLGEGTGLIHLSSGCIDVLGRAGDQDEKLVENPLKAISEMVSHDPEHPYYFIGDPALEEGLSFFQDITHTCGLNYMGQPDQNRYFITAAGTLKQSCLYPSRFNTPRLEDITAIRFLALKGIRGFFPALATALCKKIFPQIPVDYHQLDLLSEHGERVTPLLLSHRLQDLEQRDFFVSKIEQYCEPGLAIGIPALFSPLVATEIGQRLLKQFKVYLFEMATIPPSLPGYHLGQALLEYAVSLGVEPFIGGKVTKFSGTGRTVNGVFIKRPGRDVHIAGDNFLLATGSLLGGGLKIKGNQIIEPLFQIPVKAPEKSSWYGTAFFKSKHPIRKAGLKVNHEMRPCSLAGESLFNNVQVAGTILAGADTITERSGGGICIGSAFKAIADL
ncbi:anaerobic glycerol-3-phosphate dehydrogenase subunit GlpB [candidate division CSSED10-310 bacterium]|uniref:Anaerobic glycerol-3-phosphate dehydrogenase subunit GlpB n=1 Tax=candidate division CSSED10-310 bacterium TaxID=2855610 RepID=A0ABV6YVT8_UNCC1